MKNIKAILFDFGGTLDNDGTDWFTRIYNNIARRTGPIDRQAFDLCAHKAADKITELPDTPKLSMDQTAYRICQHIHKYMSNSNGCEYGWDKRASRWKVQEVADDFMTESQSYLQRNRQVLSKLHEKFQLGCISNNWGNTAGWCRQFDLDDYFATMIDSTIVGATKPDKIIFLAALNELQLSAESCAYVGDRYDSDIVGAHQAGMKAIWIIGENNQQPDHRDDLTDSENSPAAHVTHLRINKLSELLEINWD